MTIPPWDIRRIKTRHVAAFNDDVLEYFINRMTDMNIAIRIGRAVMQEKSGATAASVSNR